MTTKNVNLDTETGEIVDPVVRPFADFLREQSEGTTHDEMSEALHELIERVRETGKKGTLTLTITVATLKDDANTLLVTDDVKLRKPQFARKPSVFYADDHGNLSRRDPRQLSFDSLKAAPEPAPAKEPKKKAESQ